MSIHANVVPVDRVTQARLLQIWRAVNTPAADARRLALVSGFTVAGKIKVKVVPEFRRIAPLCEVRGKGASGSEIKKKAKE